MSFSLLSSLRNGARCLLTSGDKMVDSLTDACGDSYFKDLAVGMYSASIETKGFKGKYFSDLRAQGTLVWGI